MIVIKKSLVKCTIIGFIQFVLGCMIFPLFALAILGFFLEQDWEKIDAFVFCLIFEGIGAWLIYAAVNRVKMIKALKKYSAFLTEESPGVRIAKLAPLVAEKESTILKNFQWMIKQGFFKDAYVELETGCVIFHEAYWQAVDRARENEEAEKAKYVSVVCACCGGASKIVKDRGGACEYCGAPLEA